MRSNRTPLTWRIYAVLCWLLALFLVVGFLADQPMQLDLFAVTAVVFLVGTRFAWGLWCGQRLMLIGLLGHCVIWILLPFTFWVMIGGKFEPGLLVFSLPLVFYLPPVVTGIMYWRASNKRPA